MAESTFKSEVLLDFLGNLAAGVNEGIDPSLLPKNQMAGSVNVTVRGTFATHRPPYQIMALSFVGAENVQSGVESGLFQGAGYFRTDGGTECLMAAIGGRLFQFTPDAATNVSVTERTIPGDPNPATVTQAWLFQAESWMIWNDGQSFPVFFDGITSRRSTPLSYIYGSVATAFTVPNVGSDAAVSVSGAKPPVGTSVLIGTKEYTTKGHGGGSFVIFTNVNDTPLSTVAAGTQITSSAAPVGTAELPPGRMGVYGRGRVWICLPDGVSFLAGDIVGGSSGTAANKYRDAVLKVTENTFLNGGGTFKVPSSGTEIRAMIFAEQLDVSLGQGPLQVLTTDRVFSCNAPVDRTIWQNVTNPIITEPLISNGGQSQESTITANSDIWFRSVDGIRSMILGRKQFEEPGNTPQSREVEPTLSADNRALLKYGSKVFFDNRIIDTAAPTQSERGVYFSKLVVQNCDPISSLRGKAPSVYDGIWDGLNILRLVKGTFASVERLFAFCVNTSTNKIELWEILTSASTMTADNGTTPIRYEFQSPTLFNQSQEEPSKRMFLRLLDGEVFVDRLSGEVQFQAYYKPNEWPSWVPWFTWTTSAGVGDPGYRPRMGMGEPDMRVFDPVNNVPLREAYEFQFRLVITGNCRFKGARFKACSVHQPDFAQPKEIA